MFDDRAGGMPGMFDMALDTLYRGGKGPLAIGTVFMGVVAQAMPETSVGQIGAVGTTSGLVILIIMLVRETAPTFLKWTEIKAAHDNERARLQDLVDQMTGQRTADLDRIAGLESRVSEAEAKARHAENLVENARIEAEARHAALEQRTREVGHAVRNNTQRIRNVEQEIGSGSGERDPESAI